MSEKILIGGDNLCILDMSLCEKCTKLVLFLCYSRELKLKEACKFLSAAPAAMEGLKPAISLTDNALKHLNKMRSERGEDLCLRIGVKQGGCSGMSYTMDFENRANARPDDSTIEYQGFAIGKFLLF